VCGGGPENPILIGGVAKEWILAHCGTSNGCFYSSSQQHIVKEGNAMSTRPLSRRRRRRRQLLPLWLIEKRGKQKR